MCKGFTELALHINGYGILESLPCSSPGQHSGTDLGSGHSDEGPKGMRLGELAQLCLCYEVAWAPGRCCPLSQQLGSPDEHDTKLLNKMLAI